tara:strand:- start:110644 stop:111045 length:402 start_codon:yes stop_codon:yes gene_type:complete
MKTTRSKKTVIKATLSFFFLFVFVASSSYAQSFEVKGIVKGKTNTETEILSDVNIYLKGTIIGTSTNRKGEFKFPRKLNAGDVLVFSYLGFKKKEITLKNNNTFLTVIIEEDDNALLGAFANNKRYKSKKTKQ